MCDPNSPPLRTLIAACPGIMRDSLHSLVRALPRVEIVAVTDNLSAVQALVAAGNADCLVLDAELDEQAVLALAARVVNEYPALVSAVLVATREQAQFCFSHRVTHTLLRNYLDERTIRAALLPDPDEDGDSIAAHFSI